MNFVNITTAKEAFRSPEQMQTLEGVYCVERSGSQGPFEQMPRVNAADGNGSFLWLLGISHAAYLAYTLRPRLLAETSASCAQLILVVIRFHFDGTCNSRFHQTFLRLP